MRMMMTGLAGWAKMRKGNNASLRTMDTAITVTGTLLAATTLAIFVS